MEKTKSHYDQEITSMNGCGFDETSKIFYESGKHTKHAPQEDSEELEDMIDNSIDIF